MPRAAALTAKDLLALGPDRLAALLLELAEADPAIKRQLKLAVASASGSTDAAAQVRQRLATIRRSRRFLERDQRKALFKDLSLQLEAISGPVATSDPSVALALLWEFLALGNNVLARCDDSSGLLGDLFREAKRQLGTVALAARPEPLALAERVFEAFLDNGYAIYDNLITTLAPALGGDGLALLKQRFEALASQPVPVPPQEEWVPVSWGPGGPTHAHEQDERSRQCTVREGLQEVARARGDVDAFIAQYSEEQRSVPAIAATIAEQLLAAGRAEEALACLQAAAPDPGSWPRMDWESTHLSVLEAMGRRDDAQRARWSLFARCLQPEVLREYLANLPAFEDAEAEERAIALALAHPSLSQAICFLLHWPSALRQTAAVVERRHSELNGDDYELMGSLAEKLSADHPRAASLALRSMIDFTLAFTRSTRYGHAARHLQSCALLSRRIDDWGDIPDHEAYLASIRRDHARKSGFWGKMRDLGME
ncbi:MAG: hypothetical protein VKO26_07935 [Cyanobacteriota bacterium]|nr:hypothetical protein [Cyanobacteriota bacterium]